MKKVSIELPKAMLAAVDKVAKDEATTPSDIVREAIKRDLERRKGAQTLQQNDARLIAPLQALLADDLDAARSWGDLQARLRAKGYALREAGDILALFDLLGRRICKASDLGENYARLTQRIGTPFPGHSNLSLVPNRDKKG